MPIIRVEMFKGRTLDQKREMVKELTGAFLPAQLKNCPSSTPRLKRKIESPPVNCAVTFSRIEVQL